MKDAIRRHLRDELLKLMSVQRCVFAQPTITAGDVTGFFFVTVCRN